MNDDSQRQWAQDLQIRHIQRVHDEHTAFFHQMFGSVIVFAVEAIKTAALINGGSAVAGLAFVGSLYPTNPGLAVNLLWAVFIFSIGVGFAGLASGFAYFCQICYTEAVRLEERTWEPPFLKKGKHHGRWTVAAHILRVVAILFILTSYSAVGWGAWLLWSKVASAAGPL